MIAEKVSVQLGHLTLAVAAPVRLSKRFQPREFIPVPGAAALKHNEAAWAAL